MNGWMNESCGIMTFRPTIHWARLAAMLALAGLLAACAGTGGSAGKRAGTGAQSPDSAAGPGAVARAPARGGGYYLDDGPGDAPPPDLDAIPDAVPRAEPVRERNSRPYTVFGRQYRPMTQIEPYRERGVATWYGRRYHGNATSSGERYDMYAMTAAHPTLPIPSYVRVTNLDDPRSVVVRVNDRGPFLHDRLIDLSYTAAAKLGYVDKGSARVEVELITEFGEPPVAPMAGAPSFAAGAPSFAAGATPPIAAGTAATGPVAQATSQLAQTSPREVAQSEEPARLTMTQEPAVGSGVTASMSVPGAAVASGSPAVPADPGAAAETLSDSARLQVATEFRGPQDAAPTPGTGTASAGQLGAQPVTGLEPVSMSAPAARGATPVPLLERGHWLQLGAFGSADNADAARTRLSGELTRLGAPLDVVAEGGLFKLQAGPWATREAARAAADRVREQSGLQAFPIQR